MRILPYFLDLVDIGFIKMAVMLMLIEEIGRAHV